MFEFIGRTALVTGAARGQGRSHAIRLAQEGANVVLLDVCRDLDSPAYAGATESDLADTVKAVEHAGRVAFARVVDIRDYRDLQCHVDDSVDALGPIDIVSVNAGIYPSGGKAWELSPEEWREVIDINLTGAFNTVRAVVPQMLQAGRGGSIVFTSSAVSIRAVQNCANYVASKAGVLGLMKAMALELGEHKIRVNAMCPSIVGTDMVWNDRLYELFRPDLERPGLADVEPVFRTNTVLGIPWVEPIDVSEALVWLASDAARYVTGVVLPVDAGTSLL
ncbi:mycofactocin-coupled SDR family oxidoreductase [Mycobacterium sp. 1245805.9]|uniref:mycofactocin-coupled SDR family oxidoreductase n=1 Tax=Mycobacterium sp. 1245805.9 TaxID=1856862 RepID=UPI0007FE68CB|nr:mycofactocin-coupled SDR family oxidoreductase [Mycobacterium sp. 1245805.9]OBI87610.1 3-ketoacyl-ACP reductase [Mycobacterium sp. 1245805.9]